MEFDHLLQLIDAVSRSELDFFSYEEEGSKVKLGKKPRKVVTAAGEWPLSSGEPAYDRSRQMSPERLANGGERPEQENVQLIKSPLVGVFYEAPSEEAAPFVAVGDTVKKGQTLAIVEAMKLMNEIESDCDGVVKEIAVKNGETVEYGQTLFVIAAASDRRNGGNAGESSEY